MREGSLEGLLICDTYFHALNTGIAGTSALSQDAHQNYPIYGILHRVSDRIKAKAL